MVDGIVASLTPQSRIGFGLGAADRPPADSVRVVEMAGGQTATVGGVTVKAMANSHFDHPGPRASDDPQSLSFRFALGGRSITYTGDTGPSAAVAALAKGSDMLVSEVIDLDALLAQIRKSRPDAPSAMFEQMQRHLSTHHLSAAEVGKLAASAGVGRVVLTHFAVPPGPLTVSEPGLKKHIATSYDGPVDLARDLSSFEVRCQ